MTTMPRCQPRSGLEPSTASRAHFQRIDDSRQTWSWKTRSKCRVRREHGYGCVSAKETESTNV
jgi:hypothetical protein